MKCHELTVLEAANIPTKGDAYVCDLSEGGCLFCDI
jgi:hypothetical protein